MTASHLVPIAGAGWSLWRWFWLRGAGFPASWSRALGSDDLAVALDALDRAEDARAAARARAVAACEAATRSSELAVARAAEVALRQLVKRDRPGPDTANPAIDEQLQSLRTADTELQSVHDTVMALMASDRDRLSRVIAEYCNTPLFREALTWQNRSALKHALDGLVRTAPDDHTNRARERRRVVARYLQRYTLKNDTIGFFGPVAWCRFDRELAGVELRVGPLAARRWTQFEDWAIGALAEQLAYAPELFAICSLRLKPFSWLAGGALHRPPAEPHALAPAELAVLELAHDARTIGELIDRLVARGAAESTQAPPSVGRAATRSVAESHDRALAVVRDVVRAGLAIAQLELPAEVGHKERHLRALLVAAPPSEPRDEALAQLDRLEAELGAIRDAAGDPDALDRAIDAMESSFTEITSRAAKRGHGQVYAGRQIFFEDCLRGGDLTVGRAVLDGVGDALDLMLTSARWYTFEVARRYRAAFGKAHRELVRKHGVEVPLGAFLIGTAELFGHQKRELSPIIAEVRDELRRRWSEVIAVDPDARRVAVRSADCRARVAELFRAPGPGWPTARYQAPDLMLAAASADHVSRGELVAVLGELHAGVNTLLARCAFTAHPEREAVERACEADLPAPCITPVQPTADRTSTNAWAPNGLHVELAQARSWRPRDRVLAGGDLYVIDDGGALEVRSRSRGLRFDIVQFMDHYLSAEASPHFRVLRAARHLPRVTIDRLVISRERWSLQRPDFGMLLDERATRDQQFLAVHRWARALGLPRFVFAVVPGEAKPFHVDFASQLYVEMFVKFLARATTLDLSEMLPAHGEHWLEGEGGARYTSELRIAAVDPIAWSPSTTTTA